MPFVIATGTGGRVKSGSNTVAGIRSWRATQSAGTVDYTNFESPANSDGVVFRQKVVGIAEFSVEVEGVYNTDATDGTEAGTTAFRIGTSVTLDLIADRTNSRGYNNVAGIVTNVNTGLQIENAYMTFSMTVQGSGTFPAFGSVS